MYVVSFVSFVSCLFVRLSLRWSLTLPRQRYTNNAGRSNNAAGVIQTTLGNRSVLYASGTVWLCKGVQSPRPWGNPLSDSWLAQHTRSGHG